MGNINLTKMLFMGLILTFVTTTLLTNYLSFTVLNNSSIEETYKTIFENMSANYDSFSDIGNTVKDKSLVTSILNFGESAITGTVNVFVTGLKAIGTFFEMIPLFGDLLHAISLGFPLLSALITLLTLIVAIYGAMRYIQSVSNKNDLP